LRQGIDSGQIISNRSGGAYGTLQELLIRADEALEKRIEAWYNEVSGKIGQQNFLLILSTVE
jgi:hypothetical protein